jgi:hypothetical protein
MRKIALRVFASFVAALALLLCVSPARAHMMPARQGTVNLEGANAYVVLSLPIAAFPGLDADGDGRVDARELEARAVEVATSLQERITLTSSIGPARRSTLNFTLGEHAGDVAMPSTHVVVLEHFVFPSTPSDVTLGVDVLSLAPSAESITLRARRGTEIDMVVLTPDRTSRALFPSTSGVVREGATFGVHHILGGADHLVFLVALLAAGVGLRRWVTLLSTFTVAHSVSLALAAFGVVHPSPRIVEPLIAASIAIVAINGLRKERSSSLRAESALVFACGLLHGLGFSSALTELGLDGPRRLVSLVAFNVGIEIGQAMFVLVLLATIALVKAVAPTVSARAPKRLAAGISLALGIGFFVQVLVTMT